MWGMVVEMESNVTKSTGRQKSYGTSRKEVDINKHQGVLALDRISKEWKNTSGIVLPLKVTCIF